MLQSGARTDKRRQNTLDEITPSAHICVERDNKGVRSSGAIKDTPKFHRQKSKSIVYFSNIGEGGRGEKGGGVQSYRGT